MGKSSGRGRQAQEGGENEVRSVKGPVCQAEEFPLCSRAIEEKGSVQESSGSLGRSHPKADLEGGLCGGLREPVGCFKTIKQVVFQRHRKISFSSQLWLRPLPLPEL